MAIRAAGTYVSKNKGAKRGKAKGKENRFSKNKFYNLTSRLFPITNHGTTSHPKMRSKQDLTPFLVGRTFSVNQGDLECADPMNAVNSPRYFKFKVNAVCGNNCNSVFNGMEVSREKITGMIRKWHTLIEANIPITTKDGSTWRVFVNAVTKKKNPDSLKHYAKASEIKIIRKRIVETTLEHLDGIEVEKLVKILSTEGLAKEFETRCNEIYPIFAMIIKVKPIKNMQCIIVKTRSDDPAHLESDNKSDLENE